MRAEQNKTLGKLKNIQLCSNRKGFMAVYWAAYLSSSNLFTTVHHVGAHAVEQLCGGLELFLWSSHHEGQLP